MEEEAFGTTVHFLPFSCSKLLKSLSGVIAGDCGYLTAPAGVDLVLELSRVNALLPRRTDGVFPRVLHLQRTTRLARLKLSQSSFLANKKQERSTRHFKERSLLNPTEGLRSISLKSN